MGHRNIEGPWTTVAADIMGPFPKSKGQYKYVLVFEDLFTKYIEVRPLRQATTRNIVQAMKELIVFRWGCPKFFVTDNGMEFSNKMVTDRLQELGIIHTTIAPYHAQANPVEPVNRVLKTMISIFVGKDHRDWDLHLSELAFALNTSVHTATGITPAFLNFGKTRGKCQR